jgi:hypothetical protein
MTWLCITMAAHGKSGCYARTDAAPTRAFMLSKSSAFWLELKLELGFIAFTEPNEAVSIALTFCQLVRGIGKHWSAP